MTTLNSKLGPDSRNSIGMPLIGFGTYQMSTEEAETSVYKALQTGYRHIDSAQGYSNEDGTGRAIEKFLQDNNNVTRKEIFVTTKLWPGYAAWGHPEADFNMTIETCKEQLKRLKLDYVDLYLIHGPLSSLRLDQWKALVLLKRLGLAKHIGVSNYNQKRIQEIEDAGLPVPEVNEIEFHPLCQQKEMTELMKTNNIVPVAYSSLATMSTWRTKEGQGGDVKAHVKTDAQKVQNEIATRLGVSEANLLLRWGLERGYAVLTKSTNPDRIQQNFDVFDFELPAEDMAKINALDLDEDLAWAATGANPMTVEVPLATS